MIQVKEFRDMRVYDSRTGDWKNGKRIFKNYLIVTK